MKKAFLAFVILSVGIFFVACEKPKEALEESFEVTQTQEDLKILMNNGDEIVINQKRPQERSNFKNIEPKKPNVLKDLLVTSKKNNIKVLFFFATWCDPCLAILPHLQNIQRQFGEEISIYGIVIDDLVGEVENFQQAIEVFIQENEFHLPLAYQDNRKEFFTALGGIEGIPLVVLFDAEGKYIIHYLGAIPEEMMEFDLTQNLAKMRVE